MKDKTVKFNKQHEAEFFHVLHKRVNQYFRDNNISKYANRRMVFKTIFMLCLYFTPLIIMLLGGVSSFGPALVLWVVMGLGMSGIGLSVMHDANHGAYSSDKRVNSLVGFVVNFVGGYHVNWKIQHNVLHHSFTNIHGHDEDIENDVFRFSPDKPYNKAYRFQALYAPFLYSLMTLFWVVYKDFNQVVRYNKRGLLVNQGLSYRKALTEIVVYKLAYLTLTLFLPMWIIEIPWWQTLLGFLIMHFICGLILGLIFQPAHVIEDTHFFVPDMKGSMENNWAVHQLMTTANFANGSRFFSWFIGGLNFQIEHHLFPHICHIHYRKLSPIVQATAVEYNIPYFQHPTFLKALISHFRLLNDLGTGRYDAKKAAIK
jgi:linoleoyl-CoA desaturase